ncbi:MAG: SH3 domain-containing protein [Methylotenera sp.]
MQQKPINFSRQLLTLGLAASANLVFSFSAQALEFRSVVPPKAVLYDAPSKEASKLYILSGGYPVEVIVNLGDWTKVRDQLGSLSWIENKQLSSRRMVLVIVKTDIRMAEDATSALLATVDKDVMLELVSPGIKNGWVKVKHRDGIIGFVQIGSIWGAN